MVGCKLAQQSSHSKSNSLKMKRYYCTFLTASKPKTPPKSNSNLLAVLDSCNSIAQIKQAHAQFITTGLISRPIPATKLLKLISLSSFASLPYAHQLFDQISSPDLFIYNTMIKAYSLATTTRYSSPRNSLVIFRQMIRDPDVSPNQYTLVFVLKACCCCCGDGLGVWAGKQVHVCAVKLGLECNVFVGNVLIKMYGDCGVIDDARKVFEGNSERDLYSWNTMLSGYVDNGDLDRAKRLFDEMEERNVVSWSIVVAGFVQVGGFLEALELFNKMLHIGALPNEFTLVSALTACANLLALDQGRWIHAYIERCRMKMNERLLASLIDMYAKCGEIEFASKVFYDADNLKQEIWPWNAMISGFAMHGHSKEAIDVFEQMKLVNIVPNGITFVSLLSACSHGKLVVEGRKYFESMPSSYGVEPEIEHYGCLVDLLGRAGLLKEAEEMILTMPLSPDTIIWGALLAACRIHRDNEMGDRVGKVIRELDPDHSCHILLANMYSSSGRWNEAKIVRERAGIVGMKKIPGCSSIELHGMIHQFLVGDRSHPQTKHIYMLLDEMAAKLKSAGYVPETEEVLLDIDDEEDKETALSRHSEKLAIAFGLINTQPGTTIRIMKNLRVCGDCHQVTKHISKVYDREIIVRDRVRFHHFKDGQCSCNDYW